MGKRQIRFVFERSTKNTYRFEELSDDPLIGVLYVQKRAFDRLPREAEVILTSADLKDAEGKEIGQ